MKRTLLVASVLLFLALVGCRQTFDPTQTSADAFSERTQCPADAVEEVESLDHDGYRVVGCGATRYYWCNTKCCYEARDKREATASSHWLNVPTKCYRSSFK